MGIPFHRLSTFVDVIYSACLGYGFLIYAEEFVKLKNEVKQHYWINHKPLTDILFELPFKHSLGTLVLLLCIFIVLIDDFYRARITNMMIPCRSTGRFSLDVGIGFLFFLTIMLASERSSLALLFLGVIFLAGTMWGFKVRKDSLIWKDQSSDNPITRNTSNKYGAYGGGFRPIINDNWEWKVMEFRLRFTRWSHITVGCTLICMSVIVFSFDTDKRYWVQYSVISGLIYLICETVRLFNEYRIKKRLTSINGDEEKFSILGTCFWVPRFIHTLIQDLIEENKKQ